MEQMSLKNKLLLFVTIILLLSSLVTTLFLWNGLQSANRDIVSKTRNALTVEVGQRLAALSGRYGEQIATFINQSYRHSGQIHLNQWITGKYPCCRGTDSGKEAGKCFLFLLL